MKKKLWIFFVAFLFVSAFSQVKPQADKILQEAIANYDKGNYQEAIQLFHQVAELSKKSADSKALQVVFNNLGNAYSLLGQSERSLHYYLAALDYANHNKDQLGTAKIYKNIGALYSEQKDFKSALSYYNKALEQNKYLKDRQFEADCLNNIAVVQEQQNEFKQAEKSYLASLAIYKSFGDEQYIAMVQNNLAILYKNREEYPLSIKYYEQALRLSEKGNDSFAVAAIQNNLGNLYTLTGDFQKALKLCQAAFENAKAIGAKEIMVESLDGIATAYEKMGNLKESLQYRKRYEKEKESYISSDRSAQLAEMQVKYEAEKKESHIKMLTQRDKIRSLEIQEQQAKIAYKNRLIWAFLFSIVLAAVAVYFWKTKQQLRYQWEKQKAIQETEELERMRISRDIHDDLGSGLSKINFLSEILLQKTSHIPEVKSNAESIKETAKKIVENMRDLIWVLNPNNTNFANFIARMREYSTEYFEDYPIEIQYSIPEYLPDFKVSKESYRNIFMVVKETLSNISKHSDATNVCFEVELKDPMVQISISDNGKGFEGEQKGNGLKNMHYRIERMGGKFSVESKLEGGTKITMVFSVENLKHEQLNPGL